MTCSHMMISNTVTCCSFYVRCFEAGLRHTAPTWNYEPGSTRQSYHCQLGLRGTCTMDLWTEMCWTIDHCDCPTCVTLQKRVVVTYGCFACSLSPNNVFIVSRWICVLRSLKIQLTHDGSIHNVCTYVTDYTDIPFK